MKGGTHDHNPCHAITATQKSVDGISGKLQYYGCRAVQIPTHKPHWDVGKDIPDLNGTFAGMAFYVPVLSVSAVNVTSCLEKAARLSDINKGK